MARQRTKKEKSKQEGSECGKLNVVHKRKKFKNKPMCYTCYKGKQDEKWLIWKRFINIY